MKIEKEKQIEEISDVLEKLFPLARSITGKPNRQTLEILRKIIPLEIKEVRSGTRVYDWIVPKEWRLSDAWIETAEGERIVDVSDHNLHVMSYSQPVDAKMEWKQLKPHIHKHDFLKEAIPYRTTYYNENWGFCVTHDQYKRIKSEKRELTVKIDSEFKEGSLTFGELIIPGRSKKEILISCYICHPSMANDSLSGVILTAFLAKYIMQLNEIHWTYRVIFVPETIGAITYCAINESAMKNIDFGLVITTVGGPGQFSYKQSFDPKHPVNQMIESVLEKSGEKFNCYPFDIHGSDERQYSSQGFRINIGSIFRDKYYTYPFYHTSLDDLTFVTADQIFSTFQIYTQLVDEFESRLVYKNTRPNCEVMLSRHGLYPVAGGEQLPADRGRSELDLILWILFLADGTMSVADMGSRLNVSKGRITEICNTLVEKGILELL